MLKRRLPDKGPLIREGQEVWLGPSDLQPGDVLLSSSDAEFGFRDNGASDLGAFDLATPAWWVRFITGGDYSHASYFDGDRLVESTLDGVVETETATRVQGQRYVDVYRFRSTNNSPLGEDPWPVEPVNEAAKRYLHSKYAQNDLIFAGALAVSRRLPMGASELMWGLQQLLAGAIRALRNLALDQKHEHLTCAELLSRAFGEASPEGHYRLQNPSSAAPHHRLGSGLSASLRGEIEFDTRRRIEADEGPLPNLGDVTLPGLESQEDLGSLRRQFATLYTLYKLLKTSEATGEPLIHDMFAAAGIDEPELLFAKNDVPIVYSALLSEHYGAALAEREFERADEHDFVSPRDLAESLSLHEIGRAKRNLFDHP